MGSEERNDDPVIDELEIAVRGRDVTALINALENPSLDVRIAAIEALGRLGGEKSSLTLVTLARDRHGERPEIRIAALEALGGFLDDTDYADLLDEFIASDNRKVVSASRRMLRKADQSGYPRRLVARGCLDHNAIKVYGTASETGAIPLIKGFLVERMDRGDLVTSGYWGKVYAAARALGNIGGEESQRILRSLLEWLGENEHQMKGFLREERAQKIRRVALEALAGGG